MKLRKLPQLTDEERLDLFATYWSIPGINGRLAFGEVLRDPTLLGCLRNTLEARRRRLARAKARAAAEVADFKLEA